MTGIPALLGALGLVAVAFGLLSAALALFQPVTDLSWVVGNLGVGVILLAAALFAGFDGVRQRLRSAEARRVGKYGSSAVVSALLTIAMLGMLGYLAERNSRRFDWSEAKVNTLTEQTSALLASLDGDVTITAFFQRSEVADVTALLERYAAASERVTLRFVDPNSAPLEVEALGLDPESLARGLVRLERDGVGLVVTDLSESGLTNGLLRLGRGSEKKVYFVEGHNERKIVTVGDGGGERAGGRDGETPTRRDGMDRAAEALRNETYQVEALALTTRGAVPEDADALVIAGPTRPFFDHELAALDDYLARGGAVLAMVDPRANTNLYEQLERWGARLGDDVVVDPVQAIFDQATVPLAAQYSPEHPITRELRQTTLFPMVRSVEAVGGELEPIVFTGANSWAERDLAGWQAGGRAEFGEGDLDGPVPIAVAGTPRTGSTTPPDASDTPPVEAADTPPVEAPADAAAAAAPRLVVFGDSDFASNEFIEAQYNRDLFLNAVNWLLGDVDQIAIRPRLSRASRFELDAARFRTIVMLSLFVLPETIAVIGVVAWWLRRGRGGG